MIIESALAALMFFFLILGLVHATDVVEDTRGNVTQQAPVLKPLILLSITVFLFSIVNIPLSAILAAAVSSKPHIAVHTGHNTANITITYGEPSSTIGPPLVSPYYAIIVAIAALTPPAMYYIGYMLGDYLVAEEKTAWKPPSLLVHQRVVVTEEVEKPREIVRVEKEVVYLDELVT